MKTLAPTAVLVWVLVSTGTQAPAPSPAPEAAHIDALGRVWAWRSTGGAGSWSAIPDLADAEQVAVSAGSVFVARGAGSVARWDGSGTAADLPGLSDVRRISCSPEHCLVATGTGRVYSWPTVGGDPYGDGRFQAVPVGELEGVVDVAAGGAHSLALTRDGRVFAWGQNTRGQLGLGGNAGYAPSPRLVQGVSGARAIGAGVAHSVALLEDGGLRTWGANGSGQLGTPGGEDQPWPLEVQGVYASRLAVVGNATFITQADGTLLKLLAAGAQPAVSEVPDDRPQEWAGVLPFPSLAMAFAADGSVMLLREGEAHWFPPSKSASDRDGRPEAVPPPAATVSAGTRSAFLVVGASPDGGNAALGARLRALGFDVTYVREDSLATQDLGAANVVVIAPSTEGPRLRRVLRDAAVPIVSLDRFALAALGLIAEGPDQAGETVGTDLSVTSDHPLGGALRGPLPIVDPAMPLSWAIPQGDAAIVGGGRERPALFGYERGVRAGDTVTPARRVGLLLSPIVSRYQPAAWALFDAAVNWAAQEYPVGMDSRPAAVTSRRGRSMPPGGGSGTILLVAGAIPLVPADTFFKGRMQQMGFTVQEKLYSALLAEDLLNKRLLFVSHTSPNITLINGGTPTPVLTQTTGMMGVMCLTETGAGFRGSETAAQGQVLASAHPIAGGLTGTLTLSTAVGTASWGKPTAGATKVLSRLTDGTAATLFTYAQNANTVVGCSPATAPARRAHWGFQAPIVGNLTSTGEDLFDRTIMWLTGTNLPPTVSAGPDQAVTVGNPQTTLNGTVVDDGLPASPGVTQEWQWISGPAAVAFGTPNSPTTSVTLPTTGTYVLQLTAWDGAGLFSSDQVSVALYLNGHNEAPVVNAGPDRVAEMPTVGAAAVVLMGSALDDGLPGTLQPTWSKISGPGTVSFTTPNQLTTVASFTVAGSYILRLSVTDGALGSYDDVIVTANAPVLLIVGDASQLTPGDAQVRARLQALGWPVMVATASADLAPSSGSGKALVWISGSSPNALIADEFKDVTTPLVVQSSGLVDNMLMTGPVDGIDRGSVASQSQAVVSTSHPVAAGLSGTVTFNTVLGTYDWGVPSASATKIATLVGDVTKAPVFVYEAGASMVGLTAPRRRAMFGFNDVALANPTSAGRRMLDATILWMTGANAAPWANAGPDQAPILVTRSVTISLPGSVVDDGRPSPPGVVTARWTQVSGPTAMTFGSVHQASTTGTFSAPGEYVLRLAASDSLLVHSDVVTISVALQAPPNAPPSVAAGPDRTTGLGAPFQLTATASDDGLPSPPAALTFTWLQISGPAAAVIATPNAATSSVTFPALGVYLFKVSVNDSQISTSDEVHVTVVPAKQAVLIGASAAPPLSAQDQITAAQLESLGYVVSFATGVVDVTGKDLIVISESVNSAGVGTAYTAVAIPIVCMESQLWDDLGLATSVFQTNGTQVTVVTPSHPLAGGFGAGALSAYTSVGPIPAATLASGGINVAALPTIPWQATVFGYTHGATLVSGTSPASAPARRVGLFLRPDIAHADGVQLLRAAIRWAGEKTWPTLLVVGSSSLTDSDKVIRDRLNNLGYPPVEVTSAAVTATDTVGKAFVVVTPSADPVALGTKLRDVAVPIVLASSGAFATMALTGGTAGDYGTVPAQTQVAVLNSWHPLSGNLAGTRNVLTAPKTFSWGSPAAGGAKVATVVGDAGKATVFGYDAPVTMVGGVTALERRVGFWLGPDGATVLHVDGATLLTAAFNWAANSDGDRDGLGYAAELRWGANPGDPDTNDDGIPDGTAVNAGLSPTNLDMDGDSRTNVLERDAGTDPFRWDTDGDGSGDGVDCFPLDPTRSQCPWSPGDTTPPVITLTEPTNTTPWP